MRLLASNRHIVMAVLLSVLHVLLIWMFRFLPLYDYPVWLYEVRIMRALSQQPFGNVYEMVAAPVPNLGFVVPVYLLSFFLPIEGCGKILLSCCVVGFPWSVWYAVRRTSGNAETPAAFIGFPFAFNIYFFGGNAFLVGCIIMLFALGYFAPRLQSPTPRVWIALSLVLLLAYAAHLAAFVLLGVALLGIIVNLPEAGRGVRAFALALSPSLVSLAWYVSSVPPSGEVLGEWSMWGLAQNVLKPIFLFVKSYGIAHALPLSALNLLWLVLIATFMLRLLSESRKGGIVDRRFLLVAGVSLVVMMAMPDEFLGVYQPGVRFGLPAFLFVVFLFARVQVSQRWRNVFLGVALCVTLYNASLFQKVDEQMHELYNDITSYAELRGKGFCSYRFDYPPPRDAGTIAAASVDPLFGAVYYAGLELGGGEAWIFGSALVRVRTTAHRVEFREPSKEGLAKRLLTDSAKLPYDVVVMVGNDPSIEPHLKSYQGLYRRGRFWTILISH